MKPGNNYQQKQPLLTCYKTTTICLFNLLFPHCTCINVSNAKMCAQMGKQPQFSRVLLSILDLSMLYQQLPPTTSAICDTRQCKKGHKKFNF